MIDSNSLGRLSGLTVTGPDGDSIGKIKDVYEATDGGGGTFATVTTGLFAGGASFFPLDARAARRLGRRPVHQGVHQGRPPGRERRGADRSRGAAPVRVLLPRRCHDGDDRARRVPRPAGLHRVRQDDRQTVGHDTSGPTTDNAMTASEEQLRVGTERVEAGRARLRKYIVTETETRTVPVSHEEVRVEREPITDANMPNAMAGPAISEEEHEVVLTAEKPVVAKEAVPVERVRLDTETVTDQVQVSEEIRKEQIDVDGADDVYPAGTDRTTTQDQTRTSTDFDVEPRR
jgi:uncharacterized protein (TIGR02271 family)